MLYSAKDIVYKSVKKEGDQAAGVDWVAPNPTGTGLDGNPIHQMLVSPLSENHLYIATTPRDGKSMHLYTSKDGATSWTDITGDNLPTTRVPSSLNLHPSSENILYLTYEGFGADRVWKGTAVDNHWTWVNMDNNLPNTFVRSLAIDPSNTGHLFLATDYGVYKSENDGTHWMLYSDGLPPAIEGVELIVYDTQRILRLVSHGNGMWERGI